MMKLTWAEARGLGEEVKFVVTGSLTPCLTAKEVAWAQAWVRTENLGGYGPSDIRYVEREEALELEPALGGNVLGALYHPKAAHCNPKHFLRAIYKRCLQIGVEMSLGESVTDIQYNEEQDEYNVVTNRTAAYHCKKLVLATGAGSHHIGQLLGVTIPVVPVRGTMWSTKPLAQGKLKTLVFSAEAGAFWNQHNKALMQRGVPPSVSHALGGERMTHHLYLKQTHDGCIIGGGDRVVVNLDEAPNFPIDGEKVQSNKAFASTLLPMLKDHEVARTWTGVMPFSPDGRGLIGRLNCLKGQVYIISGLASHGLMQGPGAGKLLAGLMCGDQIAAAVLQEADPDRVIKRSTTIKQNVDATYKHFESSN
jgi:sarcosine oxidase subunit beta